MVFVHSVSFVCEVKPLPSGSTSTGWLRARRGPAGRRTLPYLQLATLANCYTRNTQKRRPRRPRNNRPFPSRGRGALATHRINRSLKIQDCEIDTEDFRMNASENQIVIYQPNETIRLDVRLEDETVWLTQARLGELFGVDRTVVNRHIHNIYKAGELEESATCAKKAQVQNEGGRSISRVVPFYNLDMIIAVGYRVNSLQATRFRQWATKILREYLLRGYSINSRLEQLEDKVDRRLAKHDSDIAELRDKVEFFVQTKEPPLTAKACLSPRICSRLLTSGFRKLQRLAKRPSLPLRLAPHTSTAKHQVERKERSSAPCREAGGTVVEPLLTAVGVPTQQESLRIGGFPHTKVTKDTKTYRRIRTSPPDGFRAFRVFRVW